MLQVLSPSSPLALAEQELTLSCFTTVKKRRQAKKILFLLLEIMSKKTCKDFRIHGGAAGC